MRGIIVQNVYPHMKDRTRWLLGRDRSPFVFERNIDIDDCVAEFWEDNWKWFTVGCTFDFTFPVLSHHSCHWVTLAQHEQGCTIDDDIGMLDRKAPVTFYTEDMEDQDLFIRAGLADSRRDYRTLKDNLTIEDVSARIKLLTRWKKKQLVSYRYVYKLFPL